MNPNYPAVALRARRRCEYCKAPEEIFNFPFEVDHIFPRSLGGSNATDNLALACPACNLFKSNATRGFDPENEVEKPLYNPREAQWTDHFHIDIETGHIEGITDIGRATISRLQINHSVQIEARLLWIRLNLFP